MSVKGEIKEGAGFVKEEMNEHGKSPESQRKAQEGRDFGLHPDSHIELGISPWHISTQLDQVFRIGQQREREDSCWLRFAHRLPRSSETTNRRYREKRCIRPCCVGRPDCELRRGLCSAGVSSAGRQL